MDIKYQPKGQDDLEKKFNLRKAKLVNQSAYLVGMNKLSKAKTDLENIYKDLPTADPTKLWDVKINYALARTELDVFEKMYEDEFGEKIPV